MNASSRYLVDWPSCSEAKRQIRMEGGGLGGGQIGIAAVRESFGQRIFAEDVSIGGRDCGTGAKFGSDEIPHRSRARSRMPFVVHSLRTIGIRYNEIAAFVRNNSPPDIT